MSYNFSKRFPTVNFTVRNVSPQKKRINIFGLSIPYNQSANLMSLLEISEAEIKASLTKGELGAKIRANDIIIESSSINLLEFDEDFRNFIKSANENPSDPVPGTDPASIEGGGATTIEEGGTLSGTYYGDVVCKGEATLDDNVEVIGNLIVMGQLNNNRHELIVRGNLHAQNLYFDSDNGAIAQSDIIVDGNFLCTNVFFPQTGGTGALIRVGGNFTGTNGALGTTLNAYGQNDNPGANVLVYGNFNISYVNLYGGNAAHGNAGNGGSLIVYGDATVAYELNLYGGNSVGYDAGYGGTCEVYGNLTISHDSYSVNFEGGDATNGNAGNGGTLEVHGNAIITNDDGDVRFEGGNCDSSNSTYRAGSGGHIIVHGSLVSDSDLELGGGNRYGVLSESGTVEPPDGGSLTVIGDARVDEIDVDGGGIYTDNFSPTTRTGNAGYVDVRGNLTVNEEIFAGGGGSNSGIASGGNGGNVSVRGNLVVNDVLQLQGESATGTGHYGGSAGNLTVRGNCTIGGYVDIYGGDSDHGYAGNGGNINIDGLLICQDSIYADGGNCASESQVDYAGSGGSITCYGLTSSNNIYLDSGERSGNTTVSYTPGANAFPGSLNCYGDVVVSEIYAQGCSVSTNYPNVAGSDGGGIYVNGDLISDDIYLTGGDSVGNTAGKGGILIVKGSIRSYQIGANGGNSYNSAGVGSDASLNGAGANITARNGLNVQFLNVQDGTGDVGSSPPVTTSTIELSGSSFIYSLNMTDRAGATIKPGLGQSSLKINIMVDKNTLNKLDGTASSDISGSLSDYLYISDGTQWYQIQGTTIFP